MFTFLKFVKVFQTNALNVHYNSASIDRSRFRRECFYLGILHLNLSLREKCVSFETRYVCCCTKHTLLSESSRRRSIVLPTVQKSIFQKQIRCEGDYWKVWRDFASFYIPSEIAFWRISCEDYFDVLNKQVRSFSHFSFLRHRIICCIQFFFCIFYLSSGFYFLFFYIGYTQWLFDLFIKVYSSCLCCWLNVVCLS